MSNILNQLEFISSGSLSCECGKCCLNYANECVISIFDPDIEVEIQKLGDCSDGGYYIEKESR